MRRVHFLGILLLLVGLIGFVLGCRRQPLADTRAADERAIHDVDAELLRATNAKDLERLLSHFGDDASIFPPNAPIATGKGAIRAVWSQMLTTPGLALTWHTTKVEASRAGDLGYLEGTYELTMNDPKGKPVTDHGKWVSVVKKQPDGNWKVVADIWNSNQTPSTTTRQ